MSDIRKIVWKGPFEETDIGKHLRGIVGLQRDGKFRAGHQVLYSDFGISFHYDNRWNPKPYPSKEQAIYYARERVADIVEAEREPERHEAFTRLQAELKSMREPGDAPPASTKGRSPER